jgi:hypothetical protein
VIDVEFFDIAKEKDLAVTRGEALDARADLCLTLGPLRRGVSRLSRLQAR